MTRIAYLLPAAIGGALVAALAVGLSLGATSSYLLIGVAGLLVVGSGVVRDLRRSQQEDRSFEVKSREVYLYRHLFNMVGQRRAPTLADRRWLTLAAVCLVLVMASSDVLLSNVALPGIQRDLNGSGAFAVWILVAYSLGICGGVLPAGQLVKAFRDRSVLVAALGLTIVASLGAVVAPTSAVLLVARFGQGFGMALMVPAAFGLLIASFSDGSQGGKFFGVAAAVGSLGAIASPIAGGLITDSIGWRGVFALESVLAIAALALVVPPRGGTYFVGRRFRDYLGVILLTGGVGLVSFAFIELAEGGWSALATMTLLSGLALVALLISNEQRVRNPLILFPLFRNIQFLYGSLVGMVEAAATISVLFLSTLLMQGVLDLSALDVGVAFGIFTASAFLSNAFARRLAIRVGSRWSVVLGLLLVAGALFLLRGLSVDSNYVLVLLALALFGTGVGLVRLPSLDIAVLSVPADVMGDASNMAALLRTVGATLGLGVTAAVAGSVLGHLFDPQQTAHDSAASLAFVSSMRAVFAVLGITSLVTALICAVFAPMSARPPRSRSEEMAAAVATSVL